MIRTKVQNKLGKVGTHYIIFTLIIQLLEHSLSYTY